MVHRQKRQQRLADNVEEVAWVKLPGQPVSGCMQQEVRGIRRPTSKCAARDRCQRRRQVAQSQATAQCGTLNGSMEIRNMGRKVLFRRQNFLFRRLVCLQEMVKSGVVSAFGQRYLLWRTCQMSTGSRRQNTHDSAWGDARWMHEVAKENERNVTTLIASAVDGREADPPGKKMYKDRAETIEEQAEEDKGTGRGASSGCVSGPAISATSPPPFFPLSPSSHHG
ncbi:hypothetical protein C8R47DRAFT_1234983 [Mycena vitilis]|nr:hypothetical protein C8R47DRAFT_1234983 [Mycena vitilis]